LFKEKIEKTKKAIMGRQHTKKDSFLMEGGKGGDELPGEVSQNAR